jgi:hypothetical protein
VAQQPDLRLDPARRAEPAEAVRRDNAVAWDQDRHGVRAAGPPDRLRRRAEVAREIAVGPGFAAGMSQRAARTRAVRPVDPGRTGTEKETASPSK